MTEKSETPKFKTLSVRLPEDMHAALQNLGLALGEDLSVLTRQALQEFIVSRSATVMDEVGEQLRRREAAAQSLMQYIADKPAGI